MQSFRKAPPSALTSGLCSTSFRILRDNLSGCFRSPPPGHGRKWKDAYQRSKMLFSISSKDQLWRSGGSAAEDRERRSQKGSNEGFLGEGKSRQLGGIEKWRAIERQSGW